MLNRQSRMLKVLSKQCIKLPSCVKIDYVSFNHKYFYSIFSRSISNYLYVYLQLQHADELPNITASLFQSPGGRKFLTFIIKFVRFVTKKHLKLNTSDLWEPKNIKHETANIAAKGLIVENSDSMNKQFHEFIKTADSCQNFISVLSPFFRELKVKLKDVKNQTEDIKNFQQLKNECEALKLQNPKLKEKFEKELKEIVPLLSKIESIAGEKAVKYVLNIDCYGINQDLSTVFEKFLTSIQDFKMSQEVKIKYQNIDKHLNYLEKHRLKLSDSQSHIENDLLKPLKFKNESLKENDINWKGLFERQLKDVQILVPKTPGIKIQTCPILKNSKFLLNQSEEKLNETVQQKSINTKSNEEITNVSIKQSTPTVDKSLGQDSPEQSRISVVGDRFKFDVTPKSRIR